MSAKTGIKTQVSKTLSPKASIIKEATTSSSANSRDGTTSDSDEEPNDILFQVASSPVKPNAPSDTRRRRGLFRLSECFKKRRADAGRLKSNFLTWQEFARKERMLDAESRPLNKQLLNTQKNLEAQVANLSEANMILQSELKETRKDLARTLDDLKLAQARKDAAEKDSVDIQVRIQELQQANTVLLTSLADQSSNSKYLVQQQARATENQDRLEAELRAFKSSSKSESLEAQERSLRDKIKELELSRAELENFKQSEIASRDAKIALLESKCEEVEELNEKLSFKSGRNQTELIELKTRNYEQKKALESKGAELVKQDKILGDLRENLGDLEAKVKSMADASVLDKDRINRLVEEAQHKEAKAAADKDMYDRQLAKLIDSQAAEKLRYEALVADFQAHKQVTVKDAEVIKRITTGLEMKQIEVKELVEAYQSAQAEFLATDKRRVDDLKAKDAVLAQSLTSSASATALLEETKFELRIVVNKAQEERAKSIATQENFLDVANRFKELEHQHAEAVKASQVQFAQARVDSRRSKMLRVVQRMGHLRIFVVWRTWQREILISTQADKMQSKFAEMKEMEGVIESFENTVNALEESLTKSKLKGQQFEDEIIQLTRKLNQFQDANLRLQNLVQLLERNLSEMSEVREETFYQLVEAKDCAYAMETEFYELKQVSNEWKAKYCQVESSLEDLTALYASALAEHKQAYERKDLTISQLQSRLSAVEAERLKALSGRSSLASDLEKASAALLQTQKMCLQQKTEIAELVREINDRSAQTFPIDREKDLVELKATMLLHTQELQRAVLALSESQAARADLESKKALLETQLQELTSSSQAALMEAQHGRAELVEQHRQVQLARIEHNRKFFLSAVLKKLDNRPIWTSWRSWREAVGVKLRAEVQASRQECDELARMATELTTAHTAKDIELKAECTANDSLKKQLEELASGRQAADTALLLARQECDELARIVAELTTGHILKDTELKLANDALKKHQEHLHACLSEAQAARADFEFKKASLETQLQDVISTCRSEIVRLDDALRREKSECEKLVEVVSELTAENRAKDVLIKQQQQELVQKEIRLNEEMALIRARNQKFESEARVAALKLQLKCMQRANEVRNETEAAQADLQRVNNLRKSVAQLHSNAAQLQLSLAAPLV
jgi:hypothetical protein